MILILILEITGTISGYIIHGKTASFLEQRMNESMTRYTVEPKLAEAWDELQRTVIFNLFILLCKIFNPSYKKFNNLNFFLIERESCLSYAPYRYIIYYF